MEVHLTSEDILEWLHSDSRAAERVIAEYLGAFPYVYQGRWCIVSDGDSHEYLCPLEKKEEAQLVLEAIVAYWDVDHDLAEEDPPALPEYLKLLEGPYGLTFLAPLVDGGEP